MITSGAYSLATGNIIADTAAFQQFLDDAAGDHAVLEAGDYTFGHTSISAGTRFTGTKGVTIHTAPSLPASTPLIDGASGVLVDGFKLVGGGPSVTRERGLLSLMGCSGVTVQNMVLADNAYIALEVSADGASIVSNEFYGCGRPDVTQEGGPAIWTGLGAKNIRIDGNYIHDCEWAGVYANGEGFSLSGNRIIECKEAAVFGHLDTSIIANNSIYKISRKYISGSGIEVGGYGITIASNVISAVAASCVALTDVHDSQVSGNTLMSPRQEPAYYPRGSGVSIVTTKPAPDQPAWIGILNNTFTGFSPPYALCDIGGTGAPVDYITVQNNPCPGITFASGVAVMVQAGKLGTGCSFQ